MAHTLHTSHTPDIAGIRSDYRKADLSEAHVHADPVEQFNTWLNEALASQALEPTAMTLATVDAMHRPHARIVLLKGVDRGFVFFTNYLSGKGRNLTENPHAALVFFWPELERQVRIEGSVERVGAEESDAYFASRPVGSNISAIASAQSTVIASREELERRVEELHGIYAHEVATRPEHWGGYRLIPDVLEFWQGRASRLHDRIRYRTEGESWMVERLSP